MIRAHLITMARYLAGAGVFLAVLFFALTGAASTASARLSVNLPEPEIATIKEKPRDSFIVLAQKKRFKLRRERNRFNNRRERNRFNNRRKERSRGFTNRQSNSAVSSGRAAPLGSVARRVRQRVPGQLLDARLFKDRRGNLTYKLKILGRNGVMRNVTADAYTGAILGVR